MSSQRTTGSSERIHEDPDQPLGAGPAPGSAAKGAGVGIVVAAVVGALVGAPFGFLRLLDLPLGVRVLICAAVVAAAFATMGLVIGGWVGWGAAGGSKGG